MEEDYRKYFIKKTTDESITIGEVLSPFLKETKIIDEGKEITVSYIDLLAKIDEIIDTEFFISGKEWGQVIEYILSNDKIKNLVYRDSMDSGDQKLALCFTDDNLNSDEAIVAFLGTANRREWLDDVAAAKMADSPCQEDAYDYINGLPYSKITVIGHSKGGNKAMYCAVRCDNVNRCVSFDGQGFSKDFLEKYAGAISNNSSNITNYSLSTDFVHILLEQLPGTNQWYCEGYGIDDPDKRIGSIVAQNHSPNSFFRTDSSGIATEKNYSGRIVPIFDIIAENSKTTLLKSYAAYLLSSKNTKAYDALIDYVGVLLNAILDGSDVQETIFGDLLQLGTLIGYTISFIEKEELNLDNARELLYALGFDKCDTATIIIEALTNKEFSYVDNPNNVPGIISGILGFLGNQLTDGEDDYLLKSIIWDTLGDHIDDYLDEYDFYYLWNTVESKYEEAQENENTYYSITNGVINDCIDFMHTDNFMNLVKNDNRVIDELNQLERIINNNIGLSNQPAFIDYLMIKDSFHDLKRILEEYGFRLYIGDDNYNYRTGINENSIAILGQGNDLFFGGRYSDIIIGGLGEDTISGGRGNDIIYGGAEKDSIYGGYGNDILYGENGDDNIWGDSGEDTIYAGTGLDTIHGGNDKDDIHGGDDKDWIYGEGGDDTIHGDGGNDIIDGGIGNDTIYGNKGDDVVKGSEGNDELNGGSGNDKLRGGDHSDTYHFYKSGGNDNIYDKYGSNTIVFDGVEMSDLTIAYTDTNHQNLLFTITSTNDTLKIIDFKNTADNFKYKFGDDSDSYTIEDNDGVLSFSKIKGVPSSGGYGSHW